ncbi:hypothetical protein ACS0TY_034224 [Phlomoides rotata]
MENGPIIITWPNTALGGDPTQPLGVQVPKPSREFTSKERKRANLDRVANNILQHSVGDAYLGRIRMCKTAKEIWETLTLMRKSTATDPAPEGPSTSSKGVAFKAKTEECASPT